MTKLYYTAPSDESFEDLKTQAMLLWPKIDSDNDAYGYATEKINQIKDIRNVGDNFMYIFAMFDVGNQRKLGAILKEETKKEVNERLIDGGSPEYLLI